VFAIVYSLRADLFGVKVRRMPDAAAAPAAAAPAPAAVAPSAVTAPVGASAAPAAAKGSGGPATTETASRIVITSGPKAGLELPLGNEPLTIGRSSESGLVVRDDYTSSHHARLVLWGDQWMIQDLDSTNGTWHDGARVTAPVPVKVGAPIKVGATTFELRK
jgi:pSer/pThr/pTyr-binding forkhead associated (FHA) protein